MKHTLLFCSALLLFLAAGCSDRHAIHVADATGVVTFDSKPLEDAVISFVPTIEGLRDSSALSDAEGKFTLMTAGAAQNGTMVGEYDVFVDKQIPVDNAGNPLKAETVVSEMPPATGESSAPSGMPKLKSIIPNKYHDKSKPVFHFKIEKGKKNHFVLELDSK